MILRKLIVFILLTFATPLLASTINPLSAVEQAAQPVAIPDPSPNDIKEFMRLLSDEQMRNWLQNSANASGAPESKPHRLSLREQISTGMEQVRSRLRELGHAWFLLPDVPGLLEDRWEAEMQLPRKIRSLTFVVIFLFVGAGLEWLYRQYTRLPQLRLEMQQHQSPLGRARTALMRAAIILGGQLLFALGSMGTFLTFDWPPLIETLVLNMIGVIIAVRVVRVLSVFILAPKVAELRLAPLSGKMAKYLHFHIPLIAFAFAVAISVNNVFTQLGNGREEELAQATLAVSVLMAAGICLLLFVTIYRSFRLWRHETGQNSATARHWQTYLFVMITAVFFMWLFNTGALMWSVLVLAVLIPLLRVLNAWVDYFYDQAIASLIAERKQDTEITAKPETPAEDALLTGELLADTQTEAIQQPANDIIDPFPEGQPYSTLRLITKRFVRLLAVVAALIVSGAIWGFNVLSGNPPSSVMAQAFSVLADTVFVLLVADLIWTWGKTAIDKRLAAYVPPEGSEAPGPEARMATLLPLLRMTLLVGLVTAVSISILGSLGVNIAPLIAGAGVVGIAIGFGAQSLVRDVVSGIFFLIDDAFRLGEYIESGELRGMVESISIRSLRVRHHRGAIHTIPFGELKYLTNYSRDWVIMKLEFRVPFETDLKLVKKLVKQVGAKLKENEFYGDGILQTLKSQGVRRMEEFNMVVGVKFMTKPGEQWLVRRDAYQMVRDAFEANGIRMAERNVKVEIEGGEGMSEAAKEAAAGAAQVAAEREKAPDEP